MLYARGHEVGVLREPLEFILGPFADLFLRRGAEVRKSLVLPPRPIHLVRVPLRRVGRDPSGLEPLPHLQEERLPALPPVDGAIVPEQDNLPSHLL